MPAISNLNKAHKQINQAMLEHQGQLTIGIAKSFFDEAVAQFKLSEEKIKQLQAMKFDRDIDKEDLTDIQKAHKEINSRLTSVDGDLTKEMFELIFNESVKKFNLEARTAELRSFQFERDIVTIQEKEEPEVVEETLESKLESQAVEIANLKACLSEIATLAGYANYLGKYGLKRTEPKKRK